MTTENIITTRFRVSRIRRIVFFEVNIPKEAKHIIAVETQAKLLSGTLPAIASPSVWELPIFHAVICFSANCACKAMKAPICFIPARLNRITMQMPGILPEPFHSPQLHPSGEKHFPTLLK